MVSRGPLSTMIPSVWSMKEVGARNHLALWGNKSLCSRLRHRLKTFSDRANDRSSRRRIDVDAGPEVGWCYVSLIIIFIHENRRIFLCFL
jgi:hypothetical protein